MKAALERAYELSGKDASTLKMLVAPEFYWRGIDDEDPESECGAICHILYFVCSIFGGSYLSTIPLCGSGASLEVK